VRTRLERAHRRLFVERAVDEAEIRAWAAEDAPELFHAFVFLSGLEALRFWHAARGIAEEITRDTVADLDLWIEDELRKTGRPGLANLPWLLNHFSERLIALGRLQYRFERFPREVAAGFGPEAEAPVLSLHIPATGPLAPSVCDASLRVARGFFPRHYPERPVRALVCYSWLLDPALTEHLPAGSNIVAFQRRFRIFSLPGADDAPFRALFPEAWCDAHGCRPRTALQAALRDRLLAGGTWAVHGGVLREGGDDFFQS
jgi:hypothetical protein